MGTCGMGIFAGDLGGGVSISFLLHFDFFPIYCYFPSSLGFCLSIFLSIFTCWLVQLLYGSSGSSLFSGFFTVLTTGGHDERWVLGFAFCN